MAVFKVVLNYMGRKIGRDKMVNREEKLCNRIERNEEVKNLHDKIILLYF